MSFGRFLERPVTGFYCGHRLRLPVESSACTVSWSAMGKGSSVVIEAWANCDRIARRFYE